MNVLILEPPIVQLNTAYPSGAYLSAFFKSLGHTTKWIDLNILLFYKIFSKEGLTRLFELSTDNALKLADSADKKGDEMTAFNLRRYIGQKSLWIHWIEFITAILRSSTANNISGSENAHRFVFGAHVPRGARMERFLQNIDHELSTDDARSLASYALADLADFINIAFDNNFSLVRYAESLTISESTFAQVEKGADSPVIKFFYEPLLNELFINPASTYDLVLISIPFPGTFACALATGRFFKSHFGKRVYVSFGGGFVNTELRETSEPALAKYCDSISYDRGYGSYKALLDRVSAGKKQIVFSTAMDKSIYKMRQFITGDDGRVTVIEPASENPDSDEYKNSIEYEKTVTSTLIPDFCDIDYSIYPRLIDDTNPMHRLWSDGAWIKAYMAHGCYWHKCAFCDVTLDYVKGFCPTNIKRLYDGLLEQCQKLGIYGIHFVDEAMPPSMMVLFARENIAHGSPITWWGNVRFEKFFTRDVADYLSYGGLIGVSAGLESATGNGLDAIHKGTDLQSIVGACCAFKEAGILVHAYMIYGYWWETPQDLINSMETLRQFYATGLLDSCFWHKFVLTRHSRVYNEWKTGKITGLKPIDPLEKEGAPLFAKNGLHFEGEKKSEKYGDALDYSLNQWMHGQDIEVPVQKWFKFPVPAPNVGKNFISKLIEKYENSRDKAFADPNIDSNKEVWIGGDKIELTNGRYGWFYMGEYYEAKKNAPKTEFRGKGLCVLPI